MVVEQPGHEGADHQVRAFEGLVDGRWLVHPARDRFEVVDRKGVRIEAPVPPDDVEGVVPVNEPGDTLPGPDEHLDVLAFLDEWLRGAVEIAFAIGSMFEELAVAGQIAARGADVTGGFGEQGPHRLLGRIDHPAVDGRRRDHDVIAAGERDRAEGRLEDACTRLDEDELVADRVLGKRAVLAADEVRDPGVVVDEEEVAVGDRIAPRLQFMGSEVPRPERMVGCDLLVFDLDSVDRLQRGG